MAVLHRPRLPLILPALLARDAVCAGDEAGFCAAYQRSAYALDPLSPWSAEASQ